MDRPLFIPRGRERFRQMGGPEEWGRPMPLLHASIADIPEKELVAHVLNDVRYRENLLNIKGLLTRDARVLEQVELRHFRPDVAGEVDILVVPNGAPEQSTAIQVKRFKAVVTTDEQGRDTAHVGHPRRFTELMRKGVEQANETKGVGFSQVYLWIFVAIDTRARNSGWYTYEGPDGRLRSEIKSAIAPVGLDERIGLMEFEWCQPMDRPPFELTTHDGHLTRRAEPGSQPADLTEWLREMPSPVVRVKGATAEGAPMPVR